MKLCHSRVTYIETYAYCFGYSPETDWDRFWSRLLIFHSYVHIFYDHNATIYERSVHNIIRVIKLRKIGQVPRMGQKRNAYRVLA